jgi:hypothetical protein
VRGSWTDVYLRCTYRVPRMDLRPVSRLASPPSASGRRRPETWTPFWRPTGSLATMVSQAWDLDQLTRGYDEFIDPDTAPTANSSEPVSSAEDDVRDRLREVEQMQEAIASAMDSAQAALDAAYAMPVNDECDGCHGAKEAAIQAALGRIRLLEAAGESWIRSRSGSRPRSPSCARSPRTSARSTSSYTPSSARAASCPSTPGGSKGKKHVRESGSGRGGPLGQRITVCLARGGSGRSARQGRRGRAVSHLLCVSRVSYGTYPACADHSGWPCFVPRRLPGMPAWTSSRWAPLWSVGP